MSRVVAVEYLSLDGVMEEPGWSGPYFNDEVAQFQYDNLFGSDALLLGRVTYEGFKSAWPSASDERGFADRMNSLPKYVATTTLAEGEWNATLLKGNVPDEVAGLKKELGGTLLINGSGQLFRTLHAAGLIDEYRLMIFPVVLGGGRRLFAQGSAAGAMKLVKSQVTASEVVILTYESTEGAAGR
jgi:dihydrofolate reductase